MYKLPLLILLLLLLLLLSDDCCFPSGKGSVWYGEGSREGGEVVYMCWGSLRCGFAFGRETERKAKVVLMGMEKAVIIKKGETAPCFRTNFGGDLGRPEAHGIGAGLSFQSSQND